MADTAIIDGGLRDAKLRGGFGNLNSRDRLGRWRREGPVEARRAQLVRISELPDPIMPVEGVIRADRADKHVVAGPSAA